MTKPRKETRSAFVYNEVIDHIEKKYHINTRDYANHFKNKDDITVKYNKETGSDINGHTLFSSPEYLAFIEWVKKKGILNLIEDVPYLDFWHWLLDHCFYECHNGCYEYLPVKKTAEPIQKSPDWVRTIVGIRRGSQRGWLHSGMDRVVTFNYPPLKRVGL